MVSIRDIVKPPLEPRSLVLSAETLFKCPEPIAVGTVVGDPERVCVGANDPAARTVGGDVDETTEGAFVPEARTTAGEAVVEPADDGIPVPEVIIGAREPVVGAEEGAVKGDEDGAVEGADVKEDDGDERASRHGSLLQTPRQEE